MAARTAVVFDVERPPRFTRAHVAGRIGLLAVVGWIAHPLGFLWFGLPALAAILVAHKGGRRYLDEDGATVARWLGWVVGLAAYIALLTDELPGRGQSPVTYDVERSGVPTPGSALGRIVSAIPSLIVLWLLTAIGAVVWTLAILLVLLTETYPAGMWRFLHGIVRREAELFAYLASLVDPAADAVVVEASPAVPSTTPSA